MSMMAGGFDSVDSFMTGARPTQQSLDYFNSQYQNIVNTASSVNNAALAGVYQLAANSYQHIMQTRPWEMAEAVVRQTAHIFDENVIKQLSTLECFQTAKPVMQRWLMANPTVRQMYLDGRVEGYYESYIDAQPGLMGVNHYDYRRATNGMIQQTDEGWSATTWWEQLAEGDVELTFFQKSDIASSWAAMLGLIETQEYDPTSMFNSRL